MQTQTFKMKHLIKVLLTLQLANISELFNYLENTLIFELKEFQTLNKALQDELLKSKQYEPHEMVNILEKTDEVKLYNFVLACLCATEKLDEEAASELIENSNDLLKKGLEFQKQIIDFQTLGINKPKSEESPNTTATN